MIGYKWEEEGQVELKRLRNKISMSLYLQVIYPKKREERKPVGEEG